MKYLSSLLAVFILCSTLLFVINYDTRQKEPRQIVRHLILTHLEIPYAGIRYIYSGNCDTREDFIQKFKDLHSWANLSAGILALPERNDLDVTVRVAQDDFAHAILRVLGENIKFEQKYVLRPASLIAADEISDLKIISDHRDSIFATFEWNIPEIMKGRALCIANRKLGQWRLTYLGIPRRNSFNLTHAYTIFSDVTLTYRDFSIDLPRLNVEPDSLYWPEDDWYFLNIPDEGNIHLTNTDILKFEQIVSLIQRKQGDVIFCCRANTFWGHIQPLLHDLLKSQINDVWFAVIDSASQEEIFFNTRLQKEWERDKTILQLHKEDDEIIIDYFEGQQLFMHYQDSEKKKVIYIEPDPNIPIDKILKIYQQNSKNDVHLVIGN